MKNIVPQNIGALALSAMMIRQALDKYKVPLDMHYADPTKVETRAQAFHAANSDYQQVKLKYAEHRDLILDLLKEARSFSMIVREMLKPILGVRYSRVWDATGFKNNSLETPRTLVDLTDLMLMMSMHLEQYSEANNPPLAYMAGQSKILHERLKNAGARLASLEADLNGLFKTRADAMKELRRYLRVVIDELHLVLDPMDQRWKEFGLNQPGRKQTPPAPENVEVKVTDNKRAEMKWPSPPRAEYFRVWMKVIGVDAAPKTIGSPSDPDFMLEELLPQSTIEISVSAVNSGGESPLSTPVVITTT